MLLQVTERNSQIFKCEMTMKWFRVKFLLKLVLRLACMISLKNKYKNKFFTSSHLYARKTAFAFNVKNNFFFPDIIARGVEDGRGTERALFHDAESHTRDIPACTIVRAPGINRLLSSTKEARCCPANEVQHENISSRRKALADRGKADSLPSR